MTRRVALVTGVGRSEGIAAAVASRLAPSWDLLLSGCPAYDRRQGGRDDQEEIVRGLGDSGCRVSYVSADLSEPSAPETLVARTVDELGRIDAVVAAHAHSVGAPLGALKATEIDRHLAVNVRATLLLVQAFAGAFRDGGGGNGRVVLFSSGQSLGPMPDELAYVASKGGLEALVISLADALADDAVTVNAVNPGPTDTGRLSGERFEEARRRFPAGRWGEPDDAARLVAWLMSADGAWMTGQVLHSEGGFRRGL